MKRFTLIFSLLMVVCFGVKAQSYLRLSEGLLATEENGQYKWTSDKLTAPEGEFNKLRVTFLQTSNNERPAGFPCVCIAEFYLYDKDGNQVALTADKFSSNATQGNEGSIEAICDGVTTGASNQYDWYWHSQYDGTPSPYGHHYLEIDLTGITADLSEYSIGWVTRRIQASPAEIVISTGATTNDALKAANESMANVVTSDNVLPVVKEAKEVTPIYTIRSVRSKNYLYYVSDGSKPKQSSTLNENSYWYFTQGTDGAVVIRNAKTSQVLGSNCSMTESGQWFISPTTYRPGVTIAQNSDGVTNCIDDQGNSTTIGFWDHSEGDNEGTTWYIEEVSRASVDCAVSELTGMYITSIGEPVTSVTTDQWYVLNNVGRGNYVSQECSKLKMRATSNLSKYNDACEKAGYLFKIIKAEDGEHYNLVSGNGLYFSLGNNSATVSLEPVNYSIGLIGESENNFYIYDITNKYSADGQESGNSFVGWSSTIPTSAGGNDSYRLLPVTLSDEELELSYVLTDNAGNEYAGDYRGIPQKDLPSFEGAYGYTITETAWNDLYLTGKINFIFPVSKVGETPNETMLAIWDNSRYLRAEGTNIRVATTTNKVLDLNALWAIYPSFENNTFKFTIKNIATGKYIYSEAADNTTINQTEGTVKLSETASEFVLPTDRDLRFADKVNLYLSINGTSDTNVLLGVNNYAHGGTNIYAPAAIYNVTITDAGYATFYASNAVSIPENVKAYYITESGINQGWVELTEIAGTVIPSKTGVILEAEAGTYAFNKTADVQQIADNKLLGTVENEMITGEGYVLGLLDGKAGLGKAKLTDNQFLNNHHKAYMPIVEAANMTATFYGFDWDGTTGIDEITDNRVQSTVIYDLTGRRVENISAPGIYIVGGKKVLVK